MTAMPSRGGMTPSPQAAARCLVRGHSQPAIGCRSMPHLRSLHFAPSTCCAPAAYPYFISFIVINVFAVVQLLVAVVLEAFAEVIDVRGFVRARGVSDCCCACSLSQTALIVLGCPSMQSDEQRLGKDEMDAFAAAWVTLDPDCTLYMSAAGLRDFLVRLPPPMGLGALTKASPDEVKSFISECRPACRGGVRLWEPAR